MAIQREQVVRTAEKYASRGRLDAAIREYQKVLAETPDDVATKNRVGDLYARSGRNDDAIKVYAQLAESYTAEGFFVKAIAIYKKVIKLDPTRLEVYERLASLYHRQGLLNEARTQYQVLADYYLKHDNPTSATAIYERMIEVDPADPALRVKLADLYREMKLLDRALGQYRSIAETMLAAGAHEEAEQVYRRALEVDATNVGFVTDAVLKLREAGEVGSAARLLAHAVELHPEAAAVARLVGLAQPGGRGAEAAERPEAAAGEAAEAAADAPTAAADGGEDVLVMDLDDVEAAPALGAVEESEAPAAAEAPAEAAPPAAAEPSVPGFGDEMELDLDEVFVLELDEDEEPPQTQVQPPPDLAGSDQPPPAFRDRSAAPRGALAFDPDVLERTAAEIQPERVRQEEDLLTEAEVLAKYGLSDKAGERLAELLEMNPTHVGALALQVRFHLDAEEHAAAAAAAGRLRTIADERSEAWRATVDRLTAAGFEIAADRVTPPEVEEAAEAEAEEADTWPGATLPGEGEAAEEAADGGELALAGDEEVGGLADLADLELELPELPAVGEEEAPAAAPEPLATAPAEPSIEPAEPSAETRRRGRPDLDSLLAEIASGVAGRRRAPRAAEPVAGPPPAIAAASADRAAPAAPAPPPPAVEPAAPPIPDEVGWLAEVERATGAIGPASGDGDGTAPPAAASGAAAEAEAEGGFFSAEDDFFDLAAELEEELTREGELADEELLLAQPKEQTLEEIVAGFKKGVSEALSAEDHATHYELGIAYREMGLLDEAIGEFQIAAKSPDLLVSCCSMLGLSFLDKGLPELAVKWYQRGLAAPGLGEEDQLGLLYDLGNAQLALGDRDAAYHVFVDLFGIDSHYRDVVARVEETRPRG